MGFKKGFKDFCGLDDDEYKGRISEYTDDRLKSQEIMQGRNEIAGSWSTGSGIGASIGGALFTGGLSLPLTVPLAAYGWRRKDVAARKKEMIEQEARRRNMELHKPSFRDYAIPIGAGLVSMGAGVGLDDAFNHATSTDIRADQAPTGSAAQQAVMQDPGRTSSAVMAGLTEQVREMGAAVDNVNPAMLDLSSLPPDFNPATVEWAAAPNASDAAGLYYGMLLAQGVELGTAKLALYECSWLIMENFESQKRAAYNLPCIHLLGVRATSCKHCQTKIEGGLYWHCGICNSEDFAICQACFESGKRCHDNAHQLKQLQCAFDSDCMTVCPTPKTYDVEILSDKCYPKTCLVDLILFTCSSCSSEVSQGLWYHCKQCSMFDLCADCYNMGEKCPADSHALEIRLCYLDCGDNLSAIEGCRWQGVRSKFCTICKESILQQRYYHCCYCLDDDFDICHPCYKAGMRCQQPDEHLLQLQLAADTTDPAAYPKTCGRKRKSPSKMKKNGRCDRCHEGFKSGYFYHCCECKKDNFDLCPACYRKGKGCDDFRHQMSMHALE